MRPAYITSKHQTTVIWEEGVTTEKTPSPDGPVGKSVTYFLDRWLVWEGITYRGRSHLWNGGPGCFMKAGWVRHEGQSSKQHFHRVCASVSASRFLPWFCTLTSLDAEPQTVRWNKLFPSLVAFGHGVLFTAISILNRTASVKHFLQ